MGEGEVIEGRYTDKMIRLYKWTSPNVGVRTVDGMMPASTWMGMEAHRINSGRGRRAEVVTNSRGWISVAVNEFDSRSYRNLSADSTKRRS